jgi:hypothetical protein
VLAYRLAIPQSSHSLIDLAVNINQGCFRHCPAIHLVADSEYRIQRSCSDGIAKSAEQAR